jgi:hypothetical protein
MKYKLFILVAVLIGFASCEKDLLDVKFDTEYTSDFQVEVDSSKGKAAFMHRDTIDPTSDEEVQKYLENIKEWNLKEYSAKFLNLSEDFNLDNVYFKIISGELEAEWFFENVSVKEATIIVLEDLNGQFDKVNTILKKAEPFVVEFSGVTDKSNITFDAESKIKAEVIASPL